MRPPWAEATGDEYRAMRLLPRAAARRLWWRAMWRLVGTTWGWTLLFLFLLPYGFGVFLVWNAAGAAGWGPGRRLAAEALIHVAFGYPVHLAYAHWSPVLMRPFVRAELIRYADEASATEGEGLPSGRR